MANSVERIKANIAKNIREIVQFELNSEKIDFLTITNIEVMQKFMYHFLLIPLKILNL